MMLPLSTIAPLIVEPAIAMPVFAVIVPEFEILPVNFVTLRASMPRPPDAEIVPALEMPPVKVGPEIAIAVLLVVIVLAPSTAMPRVEPRIIPLSTIAPAMVLPAMAMPVFAETVPALEILPEKVEALESAIAAWVAEITPEFEMPPPKLVTKST